MSPSVPPRRFASEPVETTTKSSKGGQGALPKQEEKPEPRRFNVQPVETSETSSKERKAGQDEKSKPRRFAVEPVTTEHGSSKEKAVRRFAPQLEETSNKSSKGSTSDHEQRGHVKFLPQPTETIYRTNRKPKSDSDVEMDIEGMKKPPRKFTPILLDTASRSRRAGDFTAMLQDSAKTEFGHLLHAREHRQHIRGDKTSMTEEQDPMKVDSDKVHSLEIAPDTRRKLSPLDGSAPPRRPSVASQRSHSFRCPDLDTIESSESERGSNMSSLSSSPGQGSPITTSDSSYVGDKHATRIRESVDENFAHYLLELEAKKAQQRLRDLANEAFPNSDFHEPVQHYMDNDNESDQMEIEDRPVTYDFDEDILLEMAARRESTAKINWEQMEMQRHHEQLEQERNAAKWTAKKTKDPTAPSPWWNPAATYGLEPQDNELRSMRDRARPPMLGTDLVFPRCKSPDPARFDVTQGSTVLRNQMCYLTEHAASQHDTEEDVGLWHPPENVKRDSNITVTARSTKRGSSNKGLWGGFCIDDGEAHASPSGLMVPASGPTGLMTPMAEETVNPFEQSFAAPDGSLPAVEAGLKTPPSPPSSMKNGDLPRIDTMLTEEQDLDRVMESEYPNSFITQVYNYLSLGYPSLARPFDEELSKISRIPLTKLREDDRKAKSTPRGYIRLGSDFEGGGGEGITEENCMRWQALRLYVREWARQEKDMVVTDGPGRNYGTGARRGSWGF